jgi:hypothetical protein
MDDTNLVPPAIERVRKCLLGGEVPTLNRGPPLSKVTGSCFGGLGAGVQNPKSRKAEASETSTGSFF